MEHALLICASCVMPGSPTSEKNKIPAAASDGSVSWIRLDDLAVTGRLVVISHHRGIASSYDCCTCPCPSSYNSLSDSPSSFVIKAGQTMQCACTAAYLSCNATYTYSTVTNAATWSSSNTAVATMDSTTKGLVHGKSIGTATITATFTGYTYQQICRPQCLCPATSVTHSGPSACTVRVIPVDFKQASVSTQSGTYGVTLHFVYTWNSCDGNLADLTGCNVNESVQYPGTATTYTWPKPPRNQIATNPTTGSVPGQDGKGDDYNETGPFIKPYQTANFTDTQNFSYSCTGGLSGWLDGPISIARSVSQNSSGTWVYTITKSGTSGSSNLP